MPKGRGRAVPAQFFPLQDPHGGQRSRLLCNADQLTKASVNNWSRLPVNSEEVQVNPVALPRSRAMLTTRLSTGSHANTIELLRMSLSMFPAPSMAGSPQSGPGAGSKRRTSRVGARNESRVS